MGVEFNEDNSALHSISNPHSRAHAILPSSVKEFVFKRVLHFAKYFEPQLEWKDFGLVERITLASSVVPTRGTSWVMSLMGCSSEEGDKAKKLLKSVSALGMCLFSIERLACDLE